MRHLIVWDVATGDEVLRIRKQNPGVRSVVMSTDGNTIATYDEIVEWWTCVTGEPKPPIYEEPRAPITLLSRQTERPWPRSSGGR